MIENVTMEGAHFMPPPERFEAGSQPVAQIAGWTRALKYLSDLGMDRVHAHELNLTAHLLDGVKAIEGVRLLGPAQDTERIGVLAFSVEGVHPHDVGQVLDADDVAIRVGHHCAIPLHTFFGVRSSARVSVAPMNSIEEIDRFLHSLRRVRSYFGGQ